jgi:hypothetical protein
MSAALRQKVTQLQEKIDQTGQVVKAQERCLPTLLIVGAIVPIFFFGLFYFWQPKIVQVKEGSKHVRSVKRVFYVTLAITIVIWIAMYFYAWYKGYVGMSMVCARG